jgi:hypothetical protein
VAAAEEQQEQKQQEGPEQPAEEAEQEKQQEQKHQEGPEEPAEEAQKKQQKQKQQEGPEEPAEEAEQEKQQKQKEQGKQEEEGERQAEESGEQQEEDKKGHLPSCCRMPPGSSPSNAAWTGGCCRHAHHDHASGPPALAWSRKTGGKRKAETVSQESREHCTGTLKQCSEGRAPACKRSGESQHAKAL